MAKRKKSTQKTIEFEGNEKIPNIFLPNLTKILMDTRSLTIPQLIRRLNNSVVKTMELIPEFRDGEYLEANMNIMQAIEILICNGSNDGSNIEVENLDPNMTRAMTKMTILCLNYIKACIDNPFVARIVSLHDRRPIPHKYIEFIQGENKYFAEVLSDAKKSIKEELDNANKTSYI